MVAPVRLILSSSSSSKLYDGDPGSSMSALYPFLEPLIRSFCSRRQRSSVRLFEDDSAIIVLVVDIDIDIDIEILMFTPFYD